MPRKTSETERLIGFAMDATEDALNSAIQSLTAIRNKRFPVEKKVRKARKPKQEAPKPLVRVSGDMTVSGDSVVTRIRKSKPKTNEGDEPKPIARKCTNSDWSGEMIAPEPCPDCGSKTEAK